MQQSGYGDHVYTRSSAERHRTVGWCNL